MNQLFDVDFNRWIPDVVCFRGGLAFFGLRFLSTLTGIAFLSHQAGSFLGAWGGGYIYTMMGSYDLAWKIGVLIGLIAGTMQLLMNDRPTERVLAAEAAAD